MKTLTVPVLRQLSLKPKQACPIFVNDEFEAFTECYMMVNGFLRPRCEDYAHEKLVVFSCKRRGFCPACGDWRMTKTATHLMYHVISPVLV